MNLVVLLSCMNQCDTSIVAKSNIQTDVVVVNQCNKDDRQEYTFVNKKGRECHVLFISTTERGLSRSRNMAIKNAINADICLLCDDDEFLTDDYEDTILKAYLSKNIQVATFAVERKDKSMPSDSHKLGIYAICKTSSVETTFVRKAIMNAGILFDEKMGSGTGNGAGEENKFLMDCRRAGFQMFYFPYYIAKLLSYDSQWFNGWTARYFQNQGWQSRRIFCFFLGYLFMCYELVHHYKTYSKELSFLQAIKNSHMGFFEKR